MTEAASSNFYRPEEYRDKRSGSNYNFNIDNAIIQILLSKPKKLGHNDLKIKIENILGKSIVTSTYVGHIKRLNDVGILRKEDHGIGKKVEYSLTENGMKQARLNLIGLPKEKIFLFRKIYQTILFNDISENIPIRVEVEEDFDKLILAELHVKRSDLQWRRISAADTVDSEDLIYQTRSLRDSRTVTKEYWVEREDESPVLEDIEFICYPKGNLGVVLKRIEYWQFNRYSKNTKYHQEYLCELPGFSIEEILASKRFNDADVKFAFNALRALKLIESSMEFRGKTRFIISDRILHKFLINLWIIHEAEFSFQVKKWKYFAPTSEDKNRIIYFLGEQEATRFFRQLDLARSQHNLDLRKFRTTEEYTEYIKKGMLPFLGGSGY